MKPRAFPAGLVAGVVAVCAFSHSASASIVSITSQDITNLPSISSIGAPTPYSNTGGNYINITGPSSPDVYRSPFEDASTQIIPAAYLSVPFTSIGSYGPYPATATYNIGNASTFVLLWGSPDSYNTLTFFSGANGGGTNLGSFSGDAATLLNGGTGLGHDLVTFTASAGNTIGSVVFQDDGQAAFEYADPGETPLPAALPLCATGAGLIGFLARRRKQRKTGSAFAAA